MVVEVTVGHAEALQEPYSGGLKDFVAASKVHQWRRVAVCERGCDVSVNVKWRHVANVVCEWM